MRRRLTASSYRRSRGCGGKLPGGSRQLCLTLRHAGGPSKPPRWPSPPGQSKILVVSQGFSELLGGSQLARAGPRGHSTIFQNESLRMIFPPSNSRRSTPRTRIFFPFDVVPVRVHSETPNSPHAQWASSP